MLSSLVKSGSMRVVTTRTNPTPPQRRHRPIVELLLRFRLDPKLRVLTIPLPPHDPHLSSYFIAMRSMEHESFAGWHVASSSVLGRIFFTSFHMYPCGCAMGSGRARIFFPFKGLGSEPLATTRSAGVVRRRVDDSVPEAEILRRASEGAVNGEDRANMVPRVSSTREKVFLAESDLGEPGRRSV